MNESNCLDFEMEISLRQGREYPLAVNSPGSEARKTLRFPFDEIALENRLFKLERALTRSSGKHRLALSQEQLIVPEFGQELFETLFGH